MAKPSPVRFLPQLPEQYALTFQGMVVPGQACRGNQPEAELLEIHHTPGGVFSFSSLHVFTTLSSYRKLESFLPETVF